MLTTEDTESTEFLHKEIAQAVISSAISAHKELGPGLLASVYETCLAYELTERGHRIELQKEIPLVYRNIQFQSGFRADLIVESRVLIELKAIDQSIRRPDPNAGEQLLGTFSSLKCRTHPSRPI